MPRESGASSIHLSRISEFVIGRLRGTMTAAYEAFRTPHRTGPARCAHRRDRGRGRHRGQPQGQARRRVRRGAGHQGRRAWPSPRRRPRRAPRPSSARAVPPALPPGALFVKVDNARRALALLAARIYPRQPKVIAAVTGTSGKTSVAAFTRQIWAALGYEAASVGTIGVVTPQARGLRLADHARSGRPAPHACRNWRARASRIWRSRRRRTASTSIGSTACGSRPAASPISAAIISTIIRASRPISPPSSGCSRRWWPTAAAR